MEAKLSVELDHQRAEQQILAAESAFQVASAEVKRTHMTAHQCGMEQRLVLEAFHRDAAASAEVERPQN